MWKGHYFLQLLGSSLEVLITDCEMSQELHAAKKWDLSRSQPSFYHRMDQTHYMRSHIRTEALLCLVPPDGDFSPSPTARLMHFLQLEDILPMVTYSTENSVLPTCSCSTPLWLSHCTFPLTLFPLTLLDHQTSEQTGRVPLAHSGVWSALPLCLSWKIRVCSQVETSWSNSTQGPTITRLEQDSPWWRSGR